MLLTLQKPTKAMREEAASAGFYESAWGKHPEIQVLTVEGLLDSGGIDYPRTAGANATFKKTPRAETGGGRAG